MVFASQAWFVSSDLSSMVQKITGMSSICPPGAELSLNTLAVSDLFKKIMHLIIAAHNRGS